MNPSSDVHPWNDPSLPVEDRVEALLAVLSPQEKAGQLGSFWPVPDGNGSSGDAAPMESALHAGLGWDTTVQHGLGQITRNFGSEPLSVEDGIARLRDFQTKVVASSRFGIPAMAHEECLTGFTAYGATVYPAAIAWGATFNPGLIEEMAHAIGSDMARLGIHQGLSPLLDVVRDYRWGRVEETCGEDPYLVGTLGTAYVRGLQEAGVIATPKHFVGYSASKAGRNHAPVPMGRRELEDTMLPSFEMAIREGGARSIMNSYSDIDGVPVAASTDLLTGVLRDRWGFTGTVVSDYWAITFLELMHKVVCDLDAAGILALTAGIDVELPNTGAYEHLGELVTGGRLSPSLLDRAVRRVLQQKVELGLLDPGYEPGVTGEAVDLDSPRNRGIARRVAEESIVLLKNSGALPIPRTPRIAVLGPCAADAQTFMGCYSFPNHVMPNFPQLGIGVSAPSLLDELVARFGAEGIIHAQGVPVVDVDTSGIPAAVAAANSADLVILTVGDRSGLFGQGTSGEGCDVVDLRLPGVQADLVEAVLATGAPTVLLVISGRPYALGAYADRCAAIIQAFMPGEEGAAAIVDVLTGVVNPTGHLPIAIPDHAGGQPGTYLAAPLAWHSEGISNLDPRPLYPFGHGLSYTDFELTDLLVSAESVPTDGSVDVSITVANTGQRSGAEVVQLYLSDPVAQVARPIKQLIGYAKVALHAGCSRRVTFTVHTDRTSFTGADLNRIVEPGAIVFSVGSSSESRPLACEVQLTGPTRVVDEGRVLTTPVRIS